MYEFRLPDVGEGLHEAELLEWTVEVGQEVLEGDTVAVVNTEKVTVDLPAPVDGRVIEMPWSPGDRIEVGQVLLRLDSDVDSSAQPRPGGDRVEEERPPAEADVEVEVKVSSATETEITGRLGVIVAAPSTRRLAADHGVDLHRVAGSGPGGRILRRDVEAAMSAPRAAASSDAAPIEIREVKGLRELSARNLRRSREVTITCTTNFEVRGDGLLTTLERFKDETPRVTLPALVAVCAAHALGRHPHLNGHLIDDDTLAIFEQVDVSLAVATDSGLTVPVVRDVAGRRLRDIAGDLVDLAERARVNKLRPEELRGGTFTISSTGSLERDGVLATTPVINYPQIMTLWIGRIQQAARVSDSGAIEAGPVMRASLSFDHRFVDGSDATKFIADLSDALTDPVRALA